jgi:predicted permease
MTGEIVVRVLFLISIAGLGWAAGAILKLNPREISSLLIYVISPFAIFVSILQSPADWSYFEYSAGALLTASIAASIAYGLARILWSDSRVNLFSFAGGTGNTGYFGLPLILALFNTKQVAIAVFITIGLNIYEFTFGYFIAAKGTMDTRESLKRIGTLPILYVALLGMIFKGLNIEVGDTVLSNLSNFIGAYSVLGVMMIGITLASYRKVAMDWEFLVAAVGWKYVICPVAGLLLFHLLTPVSMEAPAVIALMLATPMAGNTLIVANNLGVHPEKAAFSVMVSTALAIITVPLAMSWVNGLPA